MDVGHPILVPDHPDLPLEAGKGHSPSSLKIVQAGERQNDRQNEDNRRRRDPFDLSHDSAPVINPPPKGGPKSWSFSFSNLLVFYQEHTEKQCDGLVS
jgi:hypothetical protein